MICGRIQTDVATGITYDYSACYYPDGILNSKELFMFNNDNIQRLFFIGFQNYEDIITQYVQFLRTNIEQGYFDTETQNIGLADAFK